MEDVVRAQGAENYSYEKVGNCFHMSFQLDGVTHKLAVYESKGAKTTLSRMTMDPDVFTRIADAIRDNCATGDGGRFEVSIPRFSQEKLGYLLDYLVEQKVEITHDKVEHGYRILRLRDPQGDTLTVKFHGNSTLQMQGVRAVLASMALSFLAEVLNYEQAVNAQLDTFAVKLNLAEIGNEVEGRLPVSFTRVSEVVRTQLVTAMALTKLDIELPDYCPVAFPALKGLEGFIKTELTKAGLNPAPNCNVGDYFEQSPMGFGHQMRAVQGEHVGEPIAAMLSNCYTVFNNERHGIAHLGTEVHNTRILPDLTTARTIVNKVFATLEDFCARLPT
jgi:hypothetical protein